MRVLVTGGTGFLGGHLVKNLLAQGNEVVSFARSESRHEEQKRRENNPSLKSYIGDVREVDVVRRAIHTCDAVVHCAAQKHVPWSEEFPEECFRTNVQGTINVWEAAREEGIRRALLVSTDKATRPINTYGASKFMAECVWGGPKVRLVNLWGSTGSVVYWLIAQRGQPTVKITSKAMRRYHMTAEEAVKACLMTFEATPGLYFPSPRWYRLSDLAEAVCPGQEIVETGIRRGEKLSEELGECDGYSPERRLTVGELRCLVSGSMAGAVMPV